MPARRRLVSLLAALAACATPRPPAPGPEPAPPAAPAPAPVPEVGPPPAVARDTQPRSDTLPRPVAGRRRGATPVRLAFVGDINLGTATFAGGVPADSGRELLAAARPALAGDLVLGNFEGVLADSGETMKCGKRRAVAWKGFPSTFRRPPVVEAPPPALGELGRGERGHRESGKRRKRPVKPAPAVGCFAFLTPTFLAPRLAEAGFTLLNLANNHANDFGLDGRRSTEATLSALGITTYGPLDRIVIDTVRHGGAATVVGVIGFTTYPFAYDLLDIPRSVEVVDSVRRLVDVLAVTFHGGAEGAGALHVPVAAESLGREPRGDLRAWAHAVVDAGADVVVGHGPHVMRGIEFRNGRLIAYSLGNFATYRGFNLKGPQAMTGVLQVELAEDGGFVAGRLVPMRQVPLGGPVVDPDGASARLVRDLSEEDFGPAAARIGDDGTLGSP